MNLEIVEVKAFIPAKSFEVSKQFYGDLGFEKKSDEDGVAYFVLGEASFLLQDCPKEFYPSKIEMHLLVKNVDNWHKYIQDKNISKKYEVVVSNLEIQPWQMKEFLLFDPSGVIWRIAQNI